MKYISQRDWTIWEMYRQRPTPTQILEVLTLETDMFKVVGTKGVTSVHLSCISFYLKWSTPTLNGQVQYSFTLKCPLFNKTGYNSAISEMIYHYLQHTLVIKQQISPILLIFDPNLDGTPHVLPICGPYSPCTPQSWPVLPVLPKCTLRRKPKTDHYGL